MNNKRRGSMFERELCDRLKEEGFWVHFISPNNAGAQPFDVIAARNDEAMAIDCKTSAERIFPYSRLEYNQTFAFERWLNCGNKNAVVAVKYRDSILLIDYEKLKEYGSVDLDHCFKLEEIIDVY